MSGDNYIDDGGPAFPRDHRHDGHNGMTLRDHFAGLAMQGLCANPGGPFQASESCGWSLTNCTLDNVAGTAYAMADAMLAQRGKQ